MIAPSKLKSLVYENPVTSNAGMDVYEVPQENHDYVITVDVARGVGEDYSAFIVVDITEFPHKVVAKYRNNDIKPMMFPNIIYQLAKSYNNAFILCEVNDVGDQVASIIQYDLEYQNLFDVFNERSCWSNCWTRILRKKDSTGSQDVQDSQEDWVFESKDYGGRK